MALDTLVSSMQRRMPWNVGQKILESLEVPRGRGWEQTLAKLANAESDPVLETAVTEAIEEHLLCGEKLVRFYRIEPTILNDLRTSIDDAPIEQSEFSTAFPFIL